jgi:hypothetical protein
MMRVIGHEPQWYFLLEDNGKVFVNANCNHSFLGYEFMIEFSLEELAHYKAEGLAFV